MPYKMNKREMRAFVNQANPSATPTTERAAQGADSDVESFRIEPLERGAEWHSHSGCYNVSLPSFTGGEVVRKSDYDALKARYSTELLTSLKWLASVVWLHYHDRTDLDPIQQKHLELAIIARNLRGKTNV